MNNRPTFEERKFTSKVIEDKISEVKNFIVDKELASLFENCFPNTFDTTVNFKIENGVPDTFVITGDINAMWLRDSSAQVWPYLSIINEDSSLKDMIRGVINRQTKCILLDPYANAFTDGDLSSEWANDFTDMKPGIHERKWEIDSLCYPVRLVHSYWMITNDSSCFTDEWKKAAKLIVKTFKEQQRKNDRGTYRFGRATSWSTDTVPGNGFGNPVEPVGLIVSVFRPSDDATIFPFLIPSNYFAVITLRKIAAIFTENFNEAEFVLECESLAMEIEKAIKQYAIANHLNFGEVFAYEVDGFGNKLFMDDANIPNLLSLPYLECCSPTDNVYLNTRNFVLSRFNPYFFKGSAAEGIGSPHTLINKIWPLSITMRALTSNDDEDIIHCLHYLKTTDAGTGFMHESFDKDNAKDFTRKWFAWANSLFGELILKLYNENPALLKRKQYY
ncbi:MAG: glycoside hydrolase family 125 protein [Ignavibacteriales bacterium]|nr:MAG: glycoside hydrolase family 125 protein [Ignavibacteriales bacterium]